MFPILLYFGRGGVIPLVSSFTFVSGYVFDGIDLFATYVLRSPSIKLLPR